MQEFKKQLVGNCTDRSADASSSSDLKVLAILLLLTVICLFPFLGKAFHIDEPLFLWAARHLQSDPLNFYNFTVNWQGEQESMAAVTQNPPLASYYLSFWGWLFGWKEAPLHFAFVLTGLVAVFGTYRLARDMGISTRLSLFSALIVFCTPAFFISADSVMCDMPMVAAWVWAVILWRRALKSDDRLLFLISGHVILLCALTKYFGAALIPLLLVYSITERRRPGFWLLALLVPVVYLGAYQFLTNRMYGHGLLTNAAAYATQYAVGGSNLLKLLTGLIFIGGGLVSFVCCFPIVVGKKAGICGAVGAGILFICLSTFKIQGFAAISPWYVAQAALMAVAGAGIFILAAYETFRRRDPDGLLLFLWILGTLVFASYINWTISVRNILPMAPAVGLLLGRRLMTIEAGSRIFSVRLLFASCLPAIVISVFVEQADYSLAKSAQKAAYELKKTYSGTTGTVWFQGHWGFQYYSELLGVAKPLDFKNPGLKSGDLIVVPANNCLTLPITPAIGSYAGGFSFDLDNWFSTMNYSSGAGFYSDSRGCLPYAAGPGTKEVYQVYKVH